jgi:hypothetical protein
MADFSTIMTGLNIASQLPLDPRTTRVNEATLADLGVGNNLAYTYYENMEVICMVEATRWVWREVEIGEENTGLVNVDFTYPDLDATAGIDYSGRVFNFFPLSIAGPTGDTGEAGTPGSVIRNGAGVPNNATGINGDYYINTLTWDLYFRAGGTYSVILNLRGATGATGATGSPGGDGATEVINEASSPISVTGTGVPTTDPYVVDIINLQDTTITTSFTLNNSHDKKTLFIYNGGSNIDITVPTGLKDNFYVCIYQKGSGTISFVESGTTINFPIVLSLDVKGQEYWACLEQIEDTDEFQLSGALALA